MPCTAEPATTRTDAPGNRSRHRRLRSLSATILLFIAGIATALGFSLLGFEPEASFLLFILCVFIATIETGTALWGIALGVTFLIVYDLFFLTPHLSLAIFNWTDAVSLVIFAIVSFIAGALANRMRQQVDIAEQNALMLKRLNKISTGLIDSTSAEGACDFSAEMLAKMLQRDITIHLGEPDADRIASIHGDQAAQAALECFEQGYRTKAEISDDASCIILNFPLSAKTKVHGIVSVKYPEGELSHSERSLLDSVIKQTVIAVERNELEEHARADELKIEQERFKTTLLRSVSHDLRTPLAGIQGNAEFLEENSDQIDPRERKALLASISYDARWLAGMIDNLLGMTRVQDEDVPLDFLPEVPDDVIGEAVMREMPYRGSHEITVMAADEVELVPMDGKLIRQVLINLIDNAIKHTSPDARITVSTHRSDESMVFTVSDDGGGIDPTMIEKIFMRFVSKGGEHGSKNGTGLGLSICKAIVEAHGGTISARNNEMGGATFEFSLPLNANGGQQGGKAADTETTTNKEEKEIR